MTLTSKQRAFLRAQAVSADTILYIGKGGVDSEVLAQCEGALAARELIKGKVHETAPLTAREAAEQLAPALRAEVVQVVGRKFVLYRKNHQKPVIELPGEGR